MDVQIRIKSDLDRRQMQVNQFNELGSITMRLEAHFTEPQQATQYRKGANSVFSEKVVRWQERDVQKEADFQILVQALHDHSGKHQVV
jgi:hypothetical protein